MKIYFINCTYGHGGPGDVAKNLFESSLESGNECRFAASRYIECGENHYKIGTKIDVYFHYLFGRLFDGEGRYSRITTKKLIKDITNFNPDLINIHSLMGHFINYKLFFKFLKRSSYKIVWTLHDCSSFTGHCINFERINCQKWKFKCDCCPLKNDYPKALIDRSAYNFMSKKDLFTNISNMTLITPSVWLKGLVGQSSLSKYKCLNIYNGVDISSFHPMESNLKVINGFSDKKILLFVAGIWNEMKGLRIINDLAKIISNEYKIVIIGSVSEELDENIFHINRTNSKIELAKWYSLAYIFVNPTLGDNFPTVNIEALACGTPIVTFNTGGSPEIVTEQTGIVCYEKNAECLKESIELCDIKICNSIINREKCIEESKKYSKDIFFKNYKNVF